MTGSVYGEVLDASHRPASCEFLVDRMVAARGLTGVHGTAMSGRTSLCRQIVAALRTGEALLGREVVGRRRVVVLATSTWAADDYYAAFGHDDGVLVSTLRVPNIADPAAWQYARTVCSQHKADVVVLDSVPMCLPEGVQGAAAELALFNIPVIGTFVGFASTQTVRPDDWRSEFAAGIHLRAEKGKNALDLYGRGESPAELRVAWDEQGRRFLEADADGNPLPQLASLSAVQVRDLGGRARFLHQGGGPEVMASRLMSDDFLATTQICGQGVSSTAIAAAIAKYPAEWQAGLHPHTAADPLGDEPPF